MVEWPDATAARPDVASALPFLNRVLARRHDTTLNVQGGDVGALGSAMLVARHVANYQAAADAVVALAPPQGAILDVGCGVGALSAWTAQRTGRPLVLCDQDAQAVRLAGDTFEVPTFTDLSSVDPVPVVIAMEVLEHVEPSEQPQFIDAMWRCVAADGVLILSTPDETGYPGGWSGYAPHVGCVSPGQLRDLLTAATNRAPTVFRLEGGPYAISRTRRRLERAANGVWNAVQRRLPSAARRLASQRARQQPLAVDNDQIRAFRLVAPEQGEGVGLLAVVRRLEPSP